MNACITGPYSSQPVSEILSSQVTKETSTSPDTAIQLTFKYSIDVSLLLCATIHNCNWNLYVYVRVTTLHWCVPTGTFPLMKEGLYT